ncbi:mCG1036780 [Mus musculus]|nr:mCG1036780 [Mus musculus]
MKYSSTSDPVTQRFLRNVSLGQARIPKKKEVESKVNPSREALNNQAENTEE